MFDHPEIVQYLVSEVSICGLTPCATVNFMKQGENTKNAN
jgi:hypothetical protein